MPRWARYNGQGQSGKEKALEATPWEQLSSVNESKDKNLGVKNGNVSKRFLPVYMRDTRSWSEDLHKVVKDLRENGAAEERIEEIVKKDLRRERRRIKRVNFRQNQTCCFQCRKPGHTLRDCPETAEHMDSGAGICFKCGSTEHKVSRCRAKIPPGEYPYALCFVCNQKGHLSSKCPDNPRGLYPNGGGCKMCGSVEHFKRDCPEWGRMQGIDNIALDKISTSNAASVDATEDVPLATMPSSSGNGKTKAKSKKKNKVVTF